MVAGLEYFAAFYILFIIIVGISMGSYLKFQNYGVSRYRLFALTILCYLPFWQLMKFVQFYKEDKKYSKMMLSFATIKLPIAVGMVATVLSIHDEKNKEKMTFHHLKKDYFHILDTKVLKS